MVIGDLHIMRMALPPNEADAELIVDPNAVLSQPISFQSFQAISRQNGQIRQASGAVEHEQLPQRPATQIRRRFPSGLAGLPE